MATVAGNIKLDRGAFTFAPPEKVRRNHGESITQSLDRLTTTLNALIDACTGTFKRADTAWKTLKVNFEGQNGTGGINTVVLVPTPSVDTVNDLLVFPAVNLMTGATSTVSVALTNCAGS